jgi:putative peptide zinc metalloprotease protein
MENASNDNETALPFAARQDLEFTTISFRDEECAIAKDPVRLKYFRLTPEQYLLLTLLRVPRSIEHLKREIQRAFPTIHVDVVEIQNLLQDMHEKGLVATARVGQGIRLTLKRSEQLRKSTIKVISNPLFIRLPGWDLNHFLGVVLSVFGWLLHPWMILLTLLFVGVCASFAASHYGEIQRRLPALEQFFTIAITKFVHELGHGLSCRKLGGECREMGLVFLVFSPTMFCDTSDSWRFDNKWHRMAVGAAGMYFELILSAICVVIWWNAPMGAIQNMCLNIAFVSTVSTLIFNANPLLKFDGYYILADFLEIPNMQTKATQALRNAIAWGCLGIKVPQSAFLPRTDRGLFVLYAISASLYRWVVMIGIMGFMYQILRPYRLETLGLGLASISLFTGFGTQGKQWYDILSAPRKTPMSKKKMTISLVILAAFLGFIAFVPIPWFIEAPCYSQPHLAQNVFATVPGILEEILVKPGEHVEVNQPLLRLKNDDLVDRVHTLISELDIVRKKQEAARSVSDESASRLHEDREKSILAELTKAEGWLAQTTILAPIAGRIVEPPVLQMPNEEDSKILGRWAGTPLSTKNVGAFIDVQTHLCTIAPTENYEVVLLVDQEDAKQLRSSRDVRIKIYGTPNVVIRSKLEVVAERAIRNCPPELYASFGGPIAATPTPDGRFLLDRGMIMASARITLTDERLQTGFRGSARIIVSEYSIGNWLWRWAVTKVWFRL